jgi:hypothetical protein
MVESSSSGTTGQVSVLAHGRADRWLIGVGIPAVTVLGAAALPPLARWVLDLGLGLPLRPVFALVGGIDRPWKLAVHLGIWAVIGVVVAGEALADEVAVTLTDGQLRVDGAGADRTVPRDDVAAAFADGPLLVVLDRAGRQLVRERPQVPVAALAAAFGAHGYPWRTADPNAGAYRPWKRGDGELPAPVEALLRARQPMLRKDVRRTRELREAIEELGYAVRDEGGRQHWRRLPPA